MKYISSDTNVWLDFATINRLEFPFKLPFIYFMHADAVDDELLNPPGLGDELVRLGLQKIELTDEEFFMAEEFVEKYTKPSRYDCIALAVAKVRNITLLTGDKQLRKAAEEEGVAVMGTLGILDQLFHENHIDEAEFHTCIQALIDNNGKKVRLPEDELKKRLNNSY